MVSNRNLLFQWSIFRGYVSFREGNGFIHTALLVKKPMGFLKHDFEQCYVSICWICWLQDVEMLQAICKTTYPMLDATVGMNTIPSTHFWRWFFNARLSNKNNRLRDVFCRPVLCSRKGSMVRDFTYGGYYLFSKIVEPTFWGAPPTYGHFVPSPQYFG